MPSLRPLFLATLIAALTACTGTNPPRPDAAADRGDAQTSADAREPSPAPEASAPDEAAAATDEGASQTGAADSGGQQIYYTEAEYTRMTRCVEMADISMHTAIRKRGGMKIEDAINIYRTQPEPEARMAIVEQVYADKVGNAWDYTVRHFQRCSITTAQVPQERMQMASYCMQRQMIGDLSASFKASERPVSDAYAYFANFKSPVVKQIIDAVYATDASKEEVKAQLWTGCMAPITG